MLKIRARYFLSNSALSVWFLWCCLSFEVKKYFSRVWKVLLITILIRTGFEQKDLLWFSHWFCNAWETAQWQNPGHLLSGLHASIMIFKTKQFCSHCISAVIFKRSLQLQEYGLRRAKVYHPSAKTESQFCELLVHFTCSLSIVSYATNPEDSPCFLLCEY